MSPFFSFSGLEPINPKRIVEEEKKRALATTLVLSNSPSLNAFNTFNAFDVMAQIDAANTVEKKVVHILSHIEKWTSEQIEQCTVLGERRLACVSETEKEHTLLNCKEALKAVLTKLVAPDGGGGAVRGGGGVAAWCRDVGLRADVVLGTPDERRVPLHPLNVRRAWVSGGKPPSGWIVTPNEGNRPTARRQCTGRQNWPGAAWRARPHGTAQRAAENLTSAPCR